MTDYVKTVNFAAKDALASGNPSKVAKGTEIDVEFNNIASAIVTKHDDGDVLRASDGLIATPGVSFNLDGDTGMYRIGTNNAGFTAGGTLVFDFDGSRVSFQLPIRMNDGTATVPSLSFFNDTNTGIYSSAADIMAFATAGVLRLLMGTGMALQTGVFSVPDGTASNPTLTFNNASSTGFYNPLNGTIGITLAGSSAGRISQGSFTATAVGLTTSPTGTVEYQRIGNVVTLFIPSISGTSNSTDFQLTGLPSEIQCPSGSGEFHFGSAISSSASTVGATGWISSASPSILQLLLGGSVSGWAAAGGKGTSSKGNVVTYKIR